MYLDLAPAAAPRSRPVFRSLMLVRWLSRGAGLTDWRKMQADTFSYGVVLWELITKEQTERGNWRPVVVPDECPAGVEVLLKVGRSAWCSSDWASQPGVSP